MKKPIVKTNRHGMLVFKVSILDENQIPVYCYVQVNPELLKGYYKGLCELIAASIKPFIDQIEVKNEESDE